MPCYPCSKCGKCGLFPSIKTQFVCKKCGHVSEESEICPVCGGACKIVPVINKRDMPKRPEML